MNVGYVIFLENVFSSILKTQVIDLIKKMEKDKSHKVLDRKSVV